MRIQVQVAITLALAVCIAGGGCSRPWQASSADLAPLSSEPYGRTRYSNTSHPPSQYPDGYKQASPSNPLGPVSEPNPQPIWQSSGARKVKTITIPAPEVNNYR